MLKPIDRFLNKITMYRLTLYYLIFLVTCAMIFGAVGWLHYSPLNILSDALAAIATCYVINWVLARLWGATTNAESALITGLILALLVPAFPYYLTTVIAVSILAMGTKYFLTIDKAHVFNPAAAAIVGMALLSPEHAATWWIGSVTMVIPVLLGGLLLIRKIRRANLVWWFLVTYILIIISGTLLSGGGLVFFHTLWFGFTNSAIFFFAFVMLTEPLTLPATETGQKWYAALVAFLYATPQLSLLHWSVTPELALCVGNAFSYVISPKHRLELQLLDKRQLTSDTWQFTFTKPANFKFTAGQYLEWTLPHHPIDSRGNRRYFTVASAPGENTIGLLVKFYRPSSSYKQGLQLLQKNDRIVASSLMGDFILPKDPDKKLAFIAGGVGIAPFHSFIKNLQTKSQTRDMVLLFSNRRRSDIVWADFLASAEASGLKTVYTLTDKNDIPAGWPGQVGYVNAEMIRQTIPDYHERIFYISGPQPMVQAAEQVLNNLGLPGRQIITDYFPGYTD